MFDRKLIMDFCWDGKIPVRTDYIAHKLGFNVRPIEQSYSEKAYIIIKIENDKRVIEYNKSLSTKLIRICLAFAVVEIFENFSDKETKIYNENILNINNIDYQSTLFKSFDIVFPKEALDMYIHEFKIYEISKLSKIFDGWDYHLYHQMKKLKYF